MERRSELNVKLQGSEYFEETEQDIPERGSERPSEKVANPNVDPKD